MNLKEVLFADCAEIDLVDFFFHPRYFYFKKEELL